MRTEFWWGFLKERVQLGNPKRRWENNKVHLKEMGWKGVGWVDLVYRRDKLRTAVNTVINVPVPKNTANFLTSRGTIGSSRRRLLHYCGTTILSAGT